MPEQEKDEGSFSGGFLLWLLLELIGCVIAMAIHKEKTSKGVFWGWLFPRLFEKTIFIISRGAFLTFCERRNMIEKQFIL